MNIGYNRQLAFEYAKTWAYRRNPRFYDFSDIGGDCTNFASQCLYAGTGVMNYTPVYGWYFINAGDRAASWTGVEYLYNFLVNNDGDGPFAVETGSRNMEIGDIIQLSNEEGDFYHTMVVVATNPILIAAHSNDAFMRPLDTYNYYAARYLHILGARKI